MKKILIIFGVIIAIGTVGFWGFRAFTKLASPQATANYSKNGLDVKVVYCQPSKKNRVIFGNIVPYGKLWRTGANESTEITFNKDVKIAGQPLKAGTYTFYTIPTESAWTLIFNTKLGTWGDFNYDKTKDALQVVVPSTMSNNENEKFTISYTEADSVVNMVLAWEKILVNVPISL
jgi:hypothetical protein